MSNVAAIFFFFVFVCVSDNVIICNYESMCHEIGMGLRDRLIQEAEILTSIIERRPRRGILVHFSIVFLSTIFFLSSLQ